VSTAEAKALVSSWALERSLALHIAATKAEGAYASAPMAPACRAYARRLREASALLMQPLDFEEGGDDGRS